MNSPTQIVGEFLDYWRSIARSAGTWTSSYGLFAILPALLAIATLWRIFQKAGQGGWKSIIPLVNLYTLFKIGWETSAFWMFLFSTIIIVFFYALCALLFENFAMAGAIFAGIMALFLFVMTVKLARRLAHRFGKKTAFAFFGLVLFPIVGYLILAWGKADYNLNRDRGDGVFHPDAEIAENG